MADVIMIILFPILFLWSLIQWFILKFDGMGYNRSLMGIGHTILSAYRNYAGWMTVWMLTLFIIFIFFAK